MIPFTFVCGLLKPYPDDAKKNNLDSAIQRAGVFPLFHVNVLNEIGEYCDGFVFTSECKTKISQHIIPRDQNIESMLETLTFCHGLLQDQGHMLKWISNNVNLIGNMHYDKKHKILFVTDILANNIHLFRLYGKNLNYETFGSKGKSKGQFINPRYITTTNNEIVVSDMNNNRLQFFDIKTLNFIRSVGSRGRKRYDIWHPSCIYFDFISNSLFVVDQDRICVLSAIDGSLSEALIYQPMI